MHTAALCRIAIEFAENQLCLEASEQEIKDFLAAVFEWPARLRDSTAIGKLASGCCSHARTERRKLGTPVPIVCVRIPEESIEDFQTGLLPTWLSQPSWP